MIKTWRNEDIRSNHVLDRIFQTVFDVSMGIEDRIVRIAVLSHDQSNEVQSEKLNILLKQVKG